MVVFMYLPLPHQIVPIFEESVIGFRSFQIHYNNIVSLLHGGIPSSSIIGGLVWQYFLKK